MILVLGSSLDTVFPKVLSNLRESACPFSVVDEDHPDQYGVHYEESDERPVFRIVGPGCHGSTPVGAVFVRHAVARTLNPQHLNRMGTLQSDLNRMLLFTQCPIINPPSNAYSNYSKPYQVGLLAEAGFDVPKTLVTNIPQQARQFYEECKGEVIFKGVSNVMTLAQVLKPEHFARLDFLPHSPTVFQEYVAGVDYRVHLIGDSAFVTRLVAQNEDYRRSCIINGEDVVAEPAQLHTQIIAKCVSFTKQLGLIVSGIDFKESSDGRLVALECNPYPQFTFYESRSGQPITKAVIDYLIRHQATDPQIVA
jgi:glutathione synthase/RimK-type ligase-like ATP-grasp enzyme